MRTIEIQGVEATALKQLVDYCYTGQEKSVKLSIHYYHAGKINLQEDTVESVTSAACLLQLPAVVEACCSFFARLLHPSNCIGIRLFAGRMDQL